MKIWEIRRTLSRTRGYFCGVKVLSHHSDARKDRYRELYAHRFEGLSADDLRFVLECQYLIDTGRELDLDAPRTFNEKLQWLKWKYRDPRMRTCADKVSFREYVASCVGEEYLVPMIGVYESADAVSFDSLPERFALKVNWGSGQNVICRGREGFDVTEARRQLADWMRPESNHYYDFFEPSYDGIVPKILAEEYLEQQDGRLEDWKFFCFGGEPLYVEVDIDRFTAHKRRFYDMDYRPQPFTIRYPRAEVEIPQPKRFDEMKSVAKALSAGFPFARVDLFSLGEKVKAGEITFFHDNGTGAFDPPEWDLRLGELLALPQM